MYTHFFNLFFVFSTYVNRYIFKFWRFFFTRCSSVNCRPSKYTLNNTFFRVDIYPFWRSYLVITTAISNYINQSFIRNVIDVPWNFIWMSFNHYFKFWLWINNSNSCSICISNKFIHIWFQIIHPYFLTFPFITSWCSII